MKAYVIKNKDGKYCQISFGGWIGFVSELYNAYIYHSRKRAVDFLKCGELDDCEVIEIIISEGDLEKEIKILRKALELMSHELATYEWEGLGKFARSEEIIQAEYIQQAKERL